MTNIQYSAALLPSGFHDTLNELANKRFYSTYGLIEQFIAFGYQPVIPTLIEYSDTLLGLVGESEKSYYFQMQNPEDSQLLALRANITPQIARIAQTSLKNAPRPLRLCYAGSRLLTKAESLKSGREHLQIGLELIGVSDAHAEAEVIAIARQALQSIGLGGLSLDIHLPEVTRTLIKGLAFSEQDAARLAIKRKDSEALEHIGAKELLALLQAHGDVAHFTESVTAATKNQTIIQAKELVKNIVDAIQLKQVDLPISIDALDIEHGDSYCGAGFSIFSHNPALEVARGGRYRLKNGEEAVGFTLYLEQILEHLPPHEQAPALAVAADTSLEQSAEVQNQGYRTVYAANIADTKALKALGCTHRYHNNNIETL